jgi:ribosomal protein S18 acetylase RimI-like enzyme
VPQFLLRRLGPQDCEAFRSLRLDGLQKHPEAFGASYEDEAGQSAEWFENRIKNNIILGGFNTRQQLLGVVCLGVPTAQKLKHRGGIWGMYVLAEARGSGLAQALVDGIILEARGVVEELRLSVVTSNAAAIRLYSKAGFVEYGREPRALKVAGCYYDELLMGLSL